MFVLPQSWCMFYFIVAMWFQVLAQLFVSYHSCLGVAGILNIAEYLTDCVIFPDLDRQTLLSSRFGSICLLFPYLDLTGFHFPRFGSDFPDLDWRYFHFTRFGSTLSSFFLIWIWHLSLPPYLDHTFRSRFGSYFFSSDPDVDPICFFQIPIWI